MALIKCPECNGTISDRAISCPHCGFPTQQQDNPKCVVIRGVKYDIEELIDTIKKEPEGHDLALCGFMAYDKFTSIIPGLTMEEAAYIGREVHNIAFGPSQSGHSFSKQQSSQPHCPTCGSTSLTKIGAGSRAIDGLVFGRLSVEGKAQFRCNKCGYMW